MNGAAAAAEDTPCSSRVKFCLRPPKPRRSKGAGVVLCERQLAEQRPRVSDALPPPFASLGMDSEVSAAAMIREGVEAATGVVQLCSSSFPAQVVEEDALDNSALVFVSYEREQEFEDFSPTLFISLQPEKTIVCCGSGKHRKERLQLNTIDDATRDMLLDVLRNVFPPLLLPVVRRVVFVSRTHTPFLHAR